MGMPFDSFHIFNITPVFIGLAVFVMALFFLALWWKKVPLVIGALVYLVLEGILVAFYTVYSFGGAFGPGMLLFFSSCLTTPIVLIVLLILRRKYFNNFGEDYFLRKLYFLGGLVIVFLQLSPFIGYFIVRGTCFKQTQQKAIVLIEALEVYQKDHGAFPEDLNELVPGYLDEIPQPACDNISGMHNGSNVFELTFCNNSDDVLITCYSVDGSGIQRYHMETGEWSSISFLDGACSFLE